MHQHKELSEGRWNTFNFFTQMANIGSEVIRALRWQDKNKVNSQLAAERALELLDLSIDDPKNHTSNRLRELYLLREFITDSLFFGNQYKSSYKSWENYFNAFTYVANKI
ncbi:MAG: hypothetical protein AAB693_01840 [Patescibacteria group bacterium]